MKKYLVFSTCLMCAIAASVSAQVHTLPAGFESSISKSTRTETADPTTGIVDATPEQYRRFLGETFYRIGECPELKIVDNRIRLISLPDSKYVFSGTIVVPDKIRNGYFGTDSLLLTAVNPTESEKIRHALSNYNVDVDFLSLDKNRDRLDSQLKFFEKKQAELSQMVKLRDSLNLILEKVNQYTYKEWKADGFIGSRPASKIEWAMNKSYYQERARSCLKMELDDAEAKIAAIKYHVDGARLRRLQVELAQMKEAEQYRESYDFLSRYYAEYNEQHGSPVKLKGQTHPYGNHFVVLQDSIGGIHYVQASLIKQFVAAKYYDKLINTLAGKTVCFLYHAISLIDACSGDRVYIKTSDFRLHRKHLYFCKDIVEYGNTLCAVIENDEIRFIAPIKHNPSDINEEDFFKKHEIRLQGGPVLIPESVFDAEVQRLIRDEQAEIQAYEDAQKAAVAEKKAAKERRKAELIRRFGTESGAKIAQGQVALGMSKAMCLEAWGSPTNRQQAKTLTGTSEIWYYTRTDRRLVFANDKLVEIFE